jgi:hypothetical protein
MHKAEQAEQTSLAKKMFGSTDPGQRGVSALRQPTTASAPGKHPGKVTSATQQVAWARHIPDDLRCHVLRHDISLEGVQKLRNAGVCRLSDFHFIQSSDVRNMNMSLLDQKKIEKMLESWHVMHQDVVLAERAHDSAQRSAGGSRGIREGL